MYDYADEDFEVIELKPLKIKVITDDEELLIIGYPVLLRVLRLDNNYSIWINVIISTKSSKPRPGPQCSPTIITARPGKIDNLQVIENGEITIKFKDGTLKKVLIRPTNISIYPEYRDQFGSPCIILNWAVFW